MTEVADPGSPWAHLVDADLVAQHLLILDPVPRWSTTGWILWYRETVIEKKCPVWDAGNEHYIDCSWRWTSPNSDIFTYAACGWSLTQSHDLFLRCPHGLSPMACRFKSPCGWRISYRHGPTSHKFLWLWLSIPYTFWFYTASRWLIYVLNASKFPHLYDLHWYTWVFPCKFTCLRFPHTP